MTRKRGQAALNQHMKAKRQQVEQPWQARDTRELRGRFGLMPRHEREQLWTKLLKQRATPPVLEATTLLLAREEWYDWPRALKALDPKQHADRIPALIAAAEQAEGEPPQLALAERLATLPASSAGQTWLVALLRHGSRGLREAALRALKETGTRGALWAVIEARQDRALAALADEARVAIEAREPADQIAAGQGALTVGKAAPRDGALTLSSGADRGDLSAPQPVGDTLPARGGGGPLDVSMRFEALGVAPRALSWRVWGRIILRAHGAPRAMAACLVAAIIVILALGVPWYVGVAALLLAVTLPTAIGLRQVWPLVRLLREGHPALARPSKRERHEVEYTTFDGAQRWMPAFAPGGRNKVLYLHAPAPGQLEHALWSQVRARLLGE